MYMLDLDKVLKETKPNDTRDSEWEAQHKNFWVDLG